MYIDWMALSVTFVGCMLSILGVDIGSGRSLGVSFTLGWSLVSLTGVDLDTGFGWSMEISFTLGWSLVSSMGVGLSFGGIGSSCNRVSFFDIIASVASWKIVHSYSTLDLRLLSGSWRNDLVLIAWARSFAAVTICSSAVILGQLNLLHSDQWNVFTMLDLRVFGLYTVKHL